MFLLNVLLHKLLCFTFICGFNDLSVTFNCVDIVKYLPLTLKLGYSIPSPPFFNGKSLLLNVIKFFAPLFMGIKTVNDLLCPYLMFYEHFWMVVRWIPHGLFTMTNLDLEAGF